MSKGYLGLKETMRYLDINKTEIEALVRRRRLVAFKLGGSHLRFRKDQLLLLKHELETSKEIAAVKSKGPSRIGQFWAFNGFYIVTGALLSGILFFFLTT